MVAHSLAPQVIENNARYEGLSEAIRRIKSERSEALNRIILTNKNGRCARKNGRCTTSMQSNMKA